MFRLTDNHSHPTGLRAHPGESYTAPTVALAPPPPPRIGAIPPTPLKEHPQSKGTTGPRQPARIPSPCRARARGASTRRALGAPKAATPALPTVLRTPKHTAGATSAGASRRPTCSKTHGPPALQGPAPRMPSRPCTHGGGRPTLPTHAGRPPAPAPPTQAAAARLHLRRTPRPLPPPLPQHGPAFESRREPGELRRWTGATPHSRLLLLSPPSPFPVFAGGVCGAGHPADLAALT